MNLSDKSKKSVHPYVQLARKTVERHLRGDIPVAGGFEVDGDDALWNMERACFVSIKTKAGALRGCIGTISPMLGSLDREIIANAISAATRDPRFSSMTEEELEDVVFSVDVLSLPEPVTDLAELDPKKWGVIVSNGGRKGVLLPDLDGVDSVRRQLSIAAEKAGISDMHNLVVERFSVDRYEETPE